MSHDHENFSESESFWGVMNVRASGTPKPVADNYLGAILLVACTGEEREEGGGVEGGDIQEDRQVLGSEEMGAQGKGTQGHRPGCLD